MLADGDLSVEEIELAIEKIGGRAVSHDSDNKEYALTTYTFTADRLRES